MTMIALGGIIGAGLFVGSSAVIATTGPGAVVSYLAAGVLVILVMRMLGEMAVANPSVGSFADYTRSVLGGLAGFTTGWLYWYFWSIVLAIEAVAGAEILQRWIDAPTWAMSLVLMALHLARRRRRGWVRKAAPRARQGPRPRPIRQPGASAPGPQVSTTSVRRLRARAPRPCAA
jgi:L-asparagine transporter-like permease